MDDTFIGGNASDILLLYGLQYLEQWLFQFAIFYLLKIKDLKSQRNS